MEQYSILRHRLYRYLKCLGIDTIATHVAFEILTIFQVQR